MYNIGTKVSVVSAKGTLISCGVITRQTKTGAFVKNNDVENGDVYQEWFPFNSRGVWITKTVTLATGKD